MRSKCGHTHTQRTHTTRPLHTPCRERPEGHEGRETRAAGAALRHHGWLLLASGTWRTGLDSARTVHTDGLLLLLLLMPLLLLGGPTN